MSVPTTNYNQTYEGKILVYHDIDIITTRSDYLTGTEANPLYADVGNSVSDFSAAGWELSVDDYLSFSAGEQYIGITAYGLKPLTNHTVYLKDRDVTSSCKQSGKLLGQGLRTDESGALNFVLYLSSDIDPSSSVEKMWTILELGDISSSALLRITDVDNNSTAKVNITPKKYVSKTTDVSEVTYYEEVTDFNLIQTFYADPEIVNNSGEVTLVSVVLFLKSIPDTRLNTSGMLLPSVTVGICDVENDEPVLSKVYKDSLVRKTAADIVYSSQHPNAPAVFQLAKPVKLTTGKMYGIVISADDPAFEFWVNKQGDKVYGTNDPSSGSTIRRDGKYYRKNTSGIFNALNDTDLKFSVKIAKYTDTTVTEAYVNKDYEFFTLASRAGKFLGGEWVYKEVANAAGTIAVTQGSFEVVGNNTTFTSYNPGEYLIVHDASNVVQPYVINSVANDTILTLASRVAFSNTAANFKRSITGRVYYKDELNGRMFLTDSTANSTIKFEANDVIVGTDSNANAIIQSVDVYSVDRLSLKGDVVIPAAGKIDTLFTAAQFNGLNYVYSGSVSQAVNINADSVKNIESYDGYILSRSLEVDNASLFSNSSLGINRKSLKLDATLSVATSNTGLYYTPTIEGSTIDLYTLRNIVSNTYTIVNGNNVVVDSEVGGNGIAASKHVTTKVTFANNKFAEDIRVYMTASRPANTELRLYARVHNSADPDAFDDKAWTPLAYISGADKFAANETEFFEYELGLYPYPESAKTLGGVFSTTANSNAIIASQPISRSFNANTNVSNTGNYISISNNQFVDGQQVFYNVGAGNTAISGLSQGIPYYIVNSNTSVIKLSETLGGAPIDLTAGLTQGGHSISYIQPNELIKIYNPLIPEDYIIEVVSDVSNNTITLNNAISNNNLVGTGFKIDTLKYNNAAFNNVTNDNVARYYNSTLVQYDKFDSMQIKIVFLADNTFNVPKVDQIQVIGVSA